MSLYVSIVLLSALSVLGDDPPARGTVFLLILGTTIGLVLAHGFAAWAASRLVGEDPDDHAGATPAAVLRVQLGGAAAVSALAIVAVAVAPTAHELTVARVTVAATIAALVLVESRRTCPLGRAALHGLLALLAGLIVAGLKTALVH